MMYNFKGIIMKQIEIQKITKLFVFMSILINAGDPCPIHFKFYDAGMPSWLSQKKSFKYTRR